MFYRMFGDGDDGKQCGGSLNIMVLQLFEERKEKTIVFHENVAPIWTVK